MGHHDTNMGQWTPPPGGGGVDQGPFIYIRTGLTWPEPTLPTLPMGPQRTPPPGGGIRITRPGSLRTTPTWYFYPHTLPVPSLLILCRPFPRHMLPGGCEHTTYTPSPTT